MNSAWVCPPRPCQIAKVLASAKGIVPQKSSPAEGSMRAGVPECVWVPALANVQKLCLGRLYLLIRLDYLSLRIVRGPISCTIHWVRRDGDDYFMS